MIKYRLLFLCLGVALCAGMTVAQPPIFITEFAYSPDGRYIAGGGSILRIWDTGQEMRPTEIGPYSYETSIRSLTWSPDSTRIAVASDDQFVRVWDISGELLAEFRPFEDSLNLLTSVSWSPEEELLAVAGFNHQPQIQFWDTKTYKLRSRSGGSTDTRQIAWNPLDDVLASLNYEGGVTSIIPVDPDLNGYILCPLGCKSEYSSVLAWNNTGTQLAIGYEDGNTHIVDVATNQEIGLLKQEGSVTQIAWSTDDKYLAVASVRDNRIVNVWDVVTGEMWETEVNSLTVSFSPTSDQIAFFDDVTGSPIIKNLSAIVHKNCLHRTSPER